MQPPHLRKQKVPGQQSSGSNQIPEPPEQQLAEPLPESLMDAESMQFLEELTNGSNWN